MTGVVLRKATTADASFFWKLRNEEEYRAMSVNTERIPWTTHRQWFRRSLGDKRCFLFVIEYQGEQAGTLRLDAGPSQPDGVTLSIAIVPEFRGIGLGRRALREACEAATALGFSFVQAAVKTKNKRSIAAFKRAGFAIQSGGNHVAETPDSLVCLKWKP